MGSTKTTSLLIRWVLRMQKFDFIIEYRKGKLNVAPDALSRSSPTSSCSLYTSHKDPDLPLSDVVLWEEQHKDLEVIKLLQAVAENNARLIDQYEVIEDKLYQKTYLPNNQLLYRMYVPSSLRRSLLQQNEYKKPAEKLQQITTTRPNQMLGVDLMGPLPRSSNQNEYLIVFVDYFSRAVPHPSGHCSECLFHLQKRDSDMMGCARFPPLRQGCSVCLRCVQRTV